VSRRLVILRHGRTVANASGIIQGQQDTPLDYLGVAQAMAVAPPIAVVKPAVILSSDLARARDTAAPLAALTGVEPVYDERLRELSLGTWEGLTTAAAEAAHPLEAAARAAGEDVVRGGGETYRQAGFRAAACVVGALPSVPSGGTAVVVTHGGTARGLMAVLLEQDPAHWWRYAPLGNCCWSLLVEHRLGWRLERHNVGSDLSLGPG
jgi:probable phosphoglycerate mutase